MNVLDRSLKSNSFRTGFFRGFAGAGNVFRTLKIERNARFDGSVENAWLEVGRVLRNSFDVEGEKPNEKAKIKSKR
ncbi:MAG: hypothetical protein WCO61_12580 [Alphaproteobacteria bacterium]